MRLLVFAAAVLVAGCGPADIRKVTVTGTASYKGQKLAGGLIKFVGTNGSFSAAVIQDNGTFTITDVVPGPVKVGYMPSPQGSGSSDGSKSAAPARPPVDLPGKFFDPETSGVSYTVTETTTALDVEFK